jgi:WD40 repeat protein
VLPTPPNFHLEAIHPNQKWFAGMLVMTQEPNPMDYHELVMWNAENGKLMVLQQDKGQQYEQLAFVGDQLQAFSIGLAGQYVRQFDLQRGKASASWAVKATPGHSFRNYIYQAQTGIYAYVDADQKLQVQTLTDGKSISQLSLEEAPWLFGSANGNVLAAGGYIHKPFLFFPETQQQKFLEPALHSGFINAISFSANNQRLAVGSSDGQISVWSIPDTKLLCRFVAINQGNFVSLNTNGYYRISKDAHHGVGFRMGTTVYPFDQFDLKFNRPDMIAKDLGLAPAELIATYKMAYQKRLKRMGVKEDDLGNILQLPEIKILNKIPLVTGSKNLAISVSALDNSTALTRLNVYVNDVPVYGTSGKPIQAMANQIVREELNLILSSGRNKIQVSVTNKSGLESLRESIEISCTVPAKPTLHLVTVGVSHFSNGAYNLTYADKDAQDLANLLNTPKERYQQVIVYSMLNENATREKVMGLRPVLEKTAVDDEVILFIASHGLLDNKLDYYLAMHNTNFSNPAEGSLKYEEFESLLDGIPARKKIILLDACHSGELEKETDALDVSFSSGTTGNGSVKFRGFNTGNIRPGSDLSNSFELMKELFNDLSRQTGAVVIASTSGKEFALESSDWKNGVFTYSLLEGMRSGKADQNKNTEITISELRAYVNQRVMELTNGKQHPTNRSENIEVDFRIW